MLEVIVLAAGRGTRMRSALPKVLHPIGKKPMVSHVIDTARELNAARFTSLSVTVVMLYQMLSLLTM